MKTRPPGSTPPVPPLRDGNPTNSNPKKNNNGISNGSSNNPSGILRQSANWAGMLVTLPSGIFSFVSGIYSFLATNTSIGENETVNQVANLSSRLAYFSYGLGGTLTNVENKNIFGSLGYAFNLFVAPFAPQDLIYPLTGLTSAIDTIPLTAEVISESKKLKHIGDVLHTNHNKNKIENFKYTDFKSWGQGIDRTLDAIKLSFKDMYKEFKQSNFTEAISNISKRPDFNLLSSTCGLLVSFFTLCLTPFKTAGKALRDIFGIQADVGIWQGGLNGTIDKPKEGQKYSEAGKWRSWGDKLYEFTGPPQLIATLTDFLYRILPIENLHLAALGIDRLGAASMAVGNICHDASKKAGAEYYTAA